MAYCDQDDILDQIDEDELIQLTDDDDTGDVDADIVAKAIADADAEIDGYCAARYTVPFDPVPVIIRKMSVDIAAYNLYARRRGATEGRKERYSNAVRFLRDLSKGMITLGADAPSPATDGGPAASSNKDDRVFTMGRTSDSTIGSLDNY